MGTWVGLEAAVKALVSPDMYADVLRGGCISGVVGGLIYYRDTCDFYDAHESAIWDTVADFVSDIGGGNVLSYFGRLKDVPQSSVEFKNAMVWLAVELVVDRLNSELVHCDDCGNELDEKGFDGFCGTCADKREGTGEGLDGFSIARAEKGKDNVD